MTDQRTLIIFARLPRPGEVKTRLGNTIGMTKAAAIYEELARHVFDVGNVAATTGISVLLFFDPIGSESAMRQWVGNPFEFHRQEGGNLGLRMANAFRNAFARGADRVVIVGTDVPDLTVEHLSRAFAELSRHDMAIGPSTDGGYYLLGMCSPLKEVFDGIPWGTDQVYEATVRRAEELALTSAILDMLTDIDTEEDYKAYLDRSMKS